MNSKSPAAVTAGAIHHLSVRAVVPKPSRLLVIWTVCILTI
jgi:hypothetical protein